ncbi:cytochrome c family protein [Hydrogenimonas sp.]|nr:cytochrome c family protein [Hydrogenimonas sp.]
MRRNPIAAILLFGLLVSTGGRAESDVVEIVSPKNEAIYDDAFASLVVKTPPGKIKRLEIETGEGRLYIYKNSPKSGYYCKSVKLKLGENNITVTAYTYDNRTLSKYVEVFYRSEVYEGVEDAPYGFKKIYFHNAENEKLCAKCHNMNPDFKKSQKKIIKAKGALTEDIQVLENPQDSNCYSCHEALTSRKNGHAPSVNFMCTVCHTGKTGENNLMDEGKSRYIQPDPIAPECFKCHERVEDIMKHNRSDHGPTKLGRCNKCHNPHSSPNPFFLRKPIWELCTTCHAEKASGKHIINAFVFSRNRGGHPTRGRPDPSRPGRELVCSSCHNPHGSKGPFLLRTTGSTPFKVCKRCHKK